VFCNRSGFTTTAALVINTGLQPGVYRRERPQPLQRLFSRRVLKQVPNFVASAVVNGQPGSKPELKPLAAADVSQRLLIRRAKELIAQTEPAAQLLRRLCCRTRPMLVGEACIEFPKRRILSEGQQCDPRAFRHGQFEIARLRKAHYCLADQRRLSCSIHKLASFSLPSRSRLGELVM